MDLEKPDALSVQPTKKSRHYSRYFIVIAFIGVVALVSNVFASSNISINGGNPIAIGAGVTAVTSCDDSINFEVKSEFQTTDAKFKVTNLVISNIATTSYTNASGNHPGCDGEDLEINFYHKTESGLTILTCNQIGMAVNTDISPNITPQPSHATCLQAPNNGTIFFRVANSDGSPANYSFNSLNIDPALIDFISIMSTHKDYPYFIGGRGPGGGIVYFISADPFISEGSNCASNCHYLEVAPANWNEPGVTSDATATPMSWLNAGSKGYATCLNYSNGQSRAPGNESNLGGEKENFRIGLGLSNTKKMHGAVTSGACDPGAAELVLSYPGSDSSQGQWFIPSINELNELCKFANSQETGVKTQVCRRTDIGRPEFDHGVSEADNPYINLDHHAYWSSSAGSANNQANMFVFGKTVGGGEHWTGTNHIVRPVRAF